MTLKHEEQKSFVKDIYTLGNILKKLNFEGKASVIKYI